MGKYINGMLLLFAISAISQNPSGNKQYYNIDIKSPGISDFIKYGNMSSPSYTGALDLEIPLFISSTKGINPLSITLKYDSSGFRPEKRPGLVGLNWFLNMGGAITRTVNGMPDDQMGTPNSGGASGSPVQKPTNGFIVGVRNKTHNINNVFNLSSSELYNAANLEFYLFGSADNNTSSSNNYEGDPDIFEFNFNGISGKFFMGNDGLIKVISNQPNLITVDISGMQNQYIVSSSKPLSSLIIIKDNDGNKYYFGGETKNLEYTANNNYPIITTWHMYRVEYYNGKVTKYNFRDDSALSNFFDSCTGALIQCGFPNYSGVTSSLRDFCVYSEYIQDERQLFTYGDLSNEGSGGVTLSSSLQKIAILEQIDDDDFKVDFKYTRQLHEFCTRNSTPDNYPKNTRFGSFLDLKLDEINLYTKNGTSTGNLIKKINFGFTYFGGTINSRMFLTTLTENGKPPYKFEYYDTGTLPKPITFGIDHWRFWNGKDDNTNQLIPFQNYQSNGDFSECTNSNCITRNPNFEYTLKGMLKKVTYPTGGYTRFEYEQNDYSKRLEVRSSNNYLPALYDVTNLGGGIRLKTISDSADGVNETNFKSYSYKNDSNISSGVLLAWPRYTIDWVIPAGNTLQQNIAFIRSNPIGSHIQDIPLLTYSQVIEITNGNGKKVTNYTDFVSNPDDLVSNFLDNPSLSNVTPKNLARNYMGYFFNDKSIERGKPIKEKIFDNSNNLKEQIDFVYNSDVLKLNKWSAKLHLSGPSVQSNKLYYYNDYLTQKTFTTYSSSGNILNTENYIYDSAPSYSSTTTAQNVLVKKNSITSIDNQLLETQYKYPWDAYSTTSANYLNFVNANIATSIGESQYRNSIKLSEKFTVYAKDATTNNLLLPKNEYAAKFPNTLPNVTDVGTLEKVFTYDSYDTKGNVTQYTKENGAPVSLIWGYNQSQLIAKLENVTYSSIPSATISDLQNKSDADIDGATEQVLQNALNSIRASFPNAMITTYTYNPLVGVSTITDSKGDLNTFNYDSNGRLIYVKDKDGNILSENQYHYKNQ
jgi:hypothetical protein